VSPTLWLLDFESAGPVKLAVSWKIPLSLSWFGVTALIWKRACSESAGFHSARAGPNLTFPVRSASIGQLHAKSSSNRSLMWSSM
jgi:hypothetical protein